MEDNMWQREALVRFLGLIPHRDCNRLLEDYRRSLFAAGVEGAYSLPVFAPMAVVSRPFSKDELKIFALHLRRLSLPNGGKIASAGVSRIEWPPLQPMDEYNRFVSACPSFYGLDLDLPLSELKCENPGIVCRFQRAALVCALPGRDDSDLPPAPQIRFGAAMLANFSVRLLNDGAYPYSFEWKITDYAWLPKGA